MMRQYWKIGSRCSRDVNSIMNAGSTDRPMEDTAFFLRKERFPEPVGTPRTPRSPAGTAYTISFQEKNALQSGFLWSPGY